MKGNQTAQKAHLPVISTCSPGQEEWVEFFSDISRDWRVQYDYRTSDGKLFSCVAKSVETARGRRDKWLAKLRGTA